MATVNITIPDALVPRVRAAMRARFPEFDELSDAGAFKASTGKMWQQVLAEYERDAARLQAEADARQAAVDAWDQALTDGSEIG